VSLLEFPEIPEVTTQVLSAATLNSYKRGCEYLLGISHATYALGFATTSYTEDAVGYITKVYGYCYHDKNSVYYAFTAYQGGDAAEHWQVQGDFYGDDDLWHTVIDLSGTEQSETLQDGTADLSGEGQMTAGEIYLWRFRLGSDSGSDAHMRLFGFGEVESVSGWTAVPTYTNTATSAAGDFNDLRTDLNALNTMLPPIWPMANMPDGMEIGQGVDAIYMYCGYRYRGESLLLNIRVKSWIRYFPSDYWYWRAEIRDENGNYAEIFRSSDQGGSWGSGYAWKKTKEVDLTAGTAATNIANAGITLTMGDWYQVRLRIAKVGTDDPVTIKGGIIARKSNQIPSADWPTLNAWTMGDTNIGATELNKFSTALTELYTGGSEEIWGQHPAVGDGDSVHEDSYGFFGTHGKRWLIYKEDSDSAIHYGSSFGEEYGLGGTGWSSFDLTEIGIPWGGLYYVTGVDAAWEADAAYE